MPMGKATADDENIFDTHADESCPETIATGASRIAPLEQPATTDTLRDTSGPAPHHSTQIPVSRSELQAPRPGIASQQPRPHTGSRKGPRARELWPRFKKSDGMVDNEPWHSCTVR